MIEKNITLRNFYNYAQKDQRLLPSHLAVFTAICMIRDLSSAHNAIKITRKKVMELAKVRSKTTYHRCISELAEFGYIVYTPSYNHYVGTFISFPTNKF